MAGALWALGAAVFFSLNQIAARKAMVTLGVGFGTGVVLVVGLVTGAVAALLIAGPGVLVSATRAGILYFLLAGLIHYLGGSIFMNASVQLIGAARLGSLTAAIALFSTLLAVIFLNETVTAVMGIGIGLIVVGTYLVADT